MATMINFIKKITVELQNLRADSSIHRMQYLFLKELRIYHLTAKLFRKDRIKDKASSLAFSTIFSLVPVLAIFFMLVKLFGNELLDEKVKPLIYKFIAPSSSDQLVKYLESFLSSATVEAVGSIGIVFFLFAVYSILSSIESVLNSIWHISNNRGYIDKFKTYLSLLIFVPLALAVSFYFGSYLENILVIGDSLWNGFSSFVITKIIPFVLIAFLYTFFNIAFPNDNIKLKHTLIGSIWGTILYFISKYIFFYYTKIAVSYSLIYGSLAILPLSMLWIMFLWVLILCSVEMTYVRQNYNYLHYYHNDNNQYSRKQILKIGLLVYFDILDSFLTQKNVCKEYNNISQYWKNKILLKLVNYGILDQTINQTYLPAMDYRSISLKDIALAIDGTGVVKIGLKDESNIENLLEKEYDNLSKIKVWDVYSRFYDTSH